MLRSFKIKAGTTLCFFGNRYETNRSISIIRIKNYSSDSSERIIEKSINEVILLGRVGIKPAFRGTEKHPVIIFSLATNLYQRLGNDMQQKTEWHRISVFKPLLRDYVSKSFVKGQRALVKGKLVYGQIVDANGITHSVTSIVAEDVILFNK